MSKSAKLSYFFGKKGDCYHVLPREKESIVKIIYSSGRRGKRSKRNKPVMTMDFSKGFRMSSTSNGEVVPPKMREHVFSYVNGYLVTVMGILFRGKVVNSGNILYIEDTSKINTFLRKEFLCNIGERDDKTEFGWLLTEKGMLMGKKLHTKFSGKMGSKIIEIDLIALFAEFQVGPHKNPFSNAYVGWLHDDKTIEADYVMDRMRILRFQSILVHDGRIVESIQIWGDSIKFERSKVFKGLHVIHKQPSLKTLGCYKGPSGTIKILRGNVLNSKEHRMTVLLKNEAKLVKTMYKILLKDSYFPKKLWSVKTAKAFSKEFNNFVLFMLCVWNLDKSRVKKLQVFLDLPKEVLLHHVIPFCDEFEVFVGFNQLAYFFECLTAVKRFTWIKQCKKLKDKKAKNLYLKSNGFIFENIKDHNLQKLDLATLPDFGVNFDMFIKSNWRNSRAENFVTLVFVYYLDKITKEWFTKNGDISNSPGLVSSVKELLVYLKSSMRFLKDQAKKCKSHELVKGRQFEPVSVILDIFLKCLKFCRKKGENCFLTKSKNIDRFRMYVMRSVIALIEFDDFKAKEHFTKSLKIFKELLPFLLVITGQKETSKLFEKVDNEDMLMDLIQFGKTIFNVKEPEEAPFEKTQSRIVLLSISFFSKLLQHSKYDFNQGRVNPQTSKLFWKIFDFEEILNFMNYSTYIVLKNSESFLKTREDDDLEETIKIVTIIMNIIMKLTPLVVRRCIDMKSHQGYKYLNAYLGRVGRFAHYFIVKSYEREIIYIVTPKYLELCVYLCELNDGYVQYVPAIGRDYKDSFVQFSFEKLVKKWSSSDSKEPIKWVYSKVDNTLDANIIHLINLIEKIMKSMMKLYKENIDLQKIMRTLPGRKKGEKITYIHYQPGKPKIVQFKDSICFAYQLHSPKDLFNYQFIEAYHHKFVETFLYLLCNKKSLTLEGLKALNMTNGGDTGFIDAMVKNLHVLIDVNCDTFLRVMLRNEGYLKVVLIQYSHEHNYNMECTVMRLQRLKIPQKSEAVKISLYATGVVKSVILKLMQGENMKLVRDIFDNLMVSDYIRTDSDIIALNSVKKPVLLTKKSFNTVIKNEKELELLRKLRRRMFLVTDKNSVDDLCVYNFDDDDPRLVMFNLRLKLKYIKLFWESSESSELNSESSLFFVFEFLDNQIKAFYKSFDIKIADIITLIEPLVYIRKYCQGFKNNLKSEELIKTFKKLKIVDEWIRHDRSILNQPKVPVMIRYTISRMVESIYNGVQWPIDI